MSAKISITSNGRVTCVELDGKTIGTGVEAVRFEHNSSGECKLDLSINLTNFSFKPDGYFDEFRRALGEEKPPEVLNNGRV